MHITHRRASRATIAIVGGESLLGKEVAEVLESSGLDVNVKLVASEQPADEARITRGLDEPLLMTSLQAADLAAARVVVLAGSPESSRIAYEQVRGASPAPVVIDLTGGLEDQLDARLRAPIVEAPGQKIEGRIQVIAHPAAAALAVFLLQLRQAGTIRRCIVHVFEPASERGQAGLDELQKQTVNLLSFKQLPQDVFDTQVSFNMLSQYGSEAPHSLEEIELKIDRHLASLLATGGAVPMPSLRLIQAPVFHGYSISAWVEFERNPGVEAIVGTLAAERIGVRTAEHEPPTNVGVAGQSGITVGSITPDRNQPQACWFWVVADNLRVTAENALEVIRGLLS